MRIEKSAMWVGMTVVLSEGFYFYQGKAILEPNRDCHFCDDFVQSWWLSELPKFSAPFACAPDNKHNLRIHSSHPPPQAQPIPHHSTMSAQSGMVDPAIFKDLQARTDEDAAVRDVRVTRLFPWRASCARDVIRC
jgi:hypothetical protein